MRFMEERVMLLFILTLSLFTQTSYTFCHIRRWYGCYKTETTKTKGNQRKSGYPQHQEHMTKICFCNPLINRDESVYDGKLY